MSNISVMVRDEGVLKNSIIKSGFSYKELAKKIGCSQTQISMILKGERNPSLENAINICKVIHKNFEDIFFIVNDYKRKQKQL